MSLFAFGTPIAHEVKSVEQVGNIVFRGRPNLVEIDVEIAMSNTIAHASHRGDFALEQLTEVLKTMSLRLVDEAFLKISLLGKTDGGQSDVLAEAVKSGLLVSVLVKFCAAINRVGV